MDDDRKLDSSRERGTVTERSGLPLPDPHAARPKPAAEVVSGQPMPSPDRPDDGGVRAAASDEKTGSRAAAKSGEVK